MKTQRQAKDTVASLARLIGGSILGDTVPGGADTVIHGVADIRRARAGEIAFCRDPLPADVARSLTAGALLVAGPIDAPCPQILVADPHVAFARVARHFHPLPHATEHEIHPTAVIHPTAILAAPVRIGPHTAIGAYTTIAAGTVCHPGVTVGDHVEIGPDCTLYPRVTLYDRVRLGARVVVHSGAVLGADGFGYAIEADGTRSKFPQLGDLVVGDDAEIGANTTLDRSALTTNLIGAGTKIDNLCHIGHNCSVGKNSSISALSAFAAGTHLGDRVTFAGHVVAGGGVRIADDVVVGGNSAISADVTKAGSYAGYPLQPRARAARTAVLHKRLAQLLEELRELRRRIDAIEGAANGHGRDHERPPR